MTIRDTIPNNGSVSALRHVYYLWFLLLTLLLLKVGASPVSADTLNVQRIPYANQYEAAVRISQLVYPFGEKGTPPYRAGVVILVNGEDHLEALIGASLIHHPRNGPLLYTQEDALPKITRDEIVRLAPSGTGSEAQILVVGGPDSVSDGVVREIENLGFTTERIGGDDVFETAAQVDKFLVYQGLIYHIKTKRDIIVFPEELFTESAIPASWVAHWDTSVLFARGASLPRATIEAIKARAEPPRIFIVGGTHVVPASVERELARLRVASVDRISGGTPTEVAVNFAKFKKGDFGWGATTKGSKAFVLTDFNDKKDVMSAIAGSILGHLGKHAPVLFTSGDTLDAITEEYLVSVQPFITFTPANIQKNHGYILGNTDTVGLSVESLFHDLLSGDNNLAITSVRIDPQETTVGESVRITLHAHNFSIEKRRYTIPLLVNGRLEQVQSVILEGVSDKDQSPDTDVVFTVVKQDEGEYTVETGGVTGTFKVKAEPKKASQGVVFLAFLALGIFLCAGVLVVFQRRRKVENIVQ